MSEKTVTHRSFNSKTQIEINVIVMIVLFSLGILLLPAVLTLNVPVGCVQLRNHYFEGYLSKGDLREDELRNVGYGAIPEQWHIRKGTGGIYRITNMDTKEELFESDQTWKGHYVFTKPFVIGAEDASWDIVPGSKYGYFIIRNVQYKDCLSTSFVGIFNLNVVSAYPECEGKEFEWQLNRVKCSDEDFDEYEDSEVE